MTAKAGISRAGESGSEGDKGTIGNTKSERNHCVLMYAICAEKMQCGQLL
jgi:hypothetical protein